ncbi:hypothetical protein DXV76_01140 [Rhodobacteraceae bacterium CCMM004]|nr:hypothetical protein DXV76_01140 [Rhodobacteraceae bacterium CCMM004]
MESTAQHRSETMLYMICCWDYAYRPSDDKVEGLREVSIQNGGEGQSNVSGSQRRKALAFFDAPIRLQAPQQTRARGRGVISNDVQVSTYRGPGMSGGVQMGGAGNYNLVTKAIEMTLPECARSLKDLGDFDLSKVLTQGTKVKTPATGADRVIRQIQEYWGADGWRQLFRA